MFPCSARCCGCVRTPWRGCGRGRDPCAENPAGATSQLHHFSVEALCGEPVEVCLGCASLPKAPGAPGSMPWSYQGLGFKFSTYMQGSLFLRARPEPFLVQRAKRIRGIFPTLLVILGPIGWKLQCSYSSLYQRKGRCLLIPTMHAIIVRGAKCILHLTAV